MLLYLIKRNESKFDSVLLYNKEILFLIGFIYYFLIMCPLICYIKRLSFHYFLSCFNNYWNTLYSKEKEILVNVLRDAFSIRFCCVWLIFGLSLYSLLFNKLLHQLVFFIYFNFISCINVYLLLCISPIWLLINKRKHKG